LLSGESPYREVLPNAEGKSSNAKGRSPNAEGTQKSLIINWGCLKRRKIASNGTI
jgi:hypothetical protein